MGWLRKKGCYRTKARLFRDSDIEVTLRWFHVPDDTPVLPFPHLWGGRPWRYCQEPPTRGPGELLQSKLRWDAGLPPLNPLPLLGRKDWWANGVPIAALNNPNMQPEIRPGVCLQPISCNSSCDQCPEMPVSWRAEGFETFAGLHPATMPQQEGCSYCSGATTDVPGCGGGAASGWQVQLLDPIPGLTDAVLTQVTPSEYSAGCCDNGGV